MRYKFVPFPSLSLLFMGNSHSCEQRRQRFSRSWASLKDVCQLHKPKNASDWLRLPLRIFLAGGILLIGLPLALVFSCLVTLSGFGICWGDNFGDKGEEREQKVEERGPVSRTSAGGAE